MFYKKNLENNVAFLTLQVFISVNLAIVSFKQEMRESPLQKFTNENEQFKESLVCHFHIFEYL